MATRREPQPLIDKDPLWYKDAIIYEVHVRAFRDSDGNGIGDFRGLTEKLDYLVDLGVTAIWLLPFYPSPLRDDGYDIADYTDIHTSYGTLPDFKVFLKEAHRRGLRVITELVVNHTSDQHPWFQEARRAKPGSKARDFYVWSDSPEKYSDARIIFKDFEASNWTWDPVAKSYFWHRFYSHQPDLNYDNPQVRKTILQLLDHWLNMGVDGLRLDAVPYLHEREGTSCENLPETHKVLKELRKHIDAVHEGRMLLAEANQWPEEAVAYFGEGDECHMAFHFPLMPRLFMAIRMESRYPIIEILNQTPGIPASCQWALFLRNHDELTLEMVTDEERDYMYRVYARDKQARINLGIRRRLAPLLGNDRRKIELMNGLLLSMPGTPVIYYGDEIGMGDNFYLGDRNGVRTPMQWSADRNAGFSSANPQKLYFPVIIDPEYHYEAVNVEAQQNNSSSILWWMKRLIATRKSYKAFSRGSIEFLYPDNPAVLAFVREHEDERILVVANLSRFSQAVRIDLSRHRGLTPIELGGRSAFPPITDELYAITLGEHGFFWFVLEPESRKLSAQDATSQLTMTAPCVWKDLLLSEDAHAAFSRLLPRFLATRRWFGGKARTIRASAVRDAIPVTRGAVLWIATVEYTEGEPETYAIPVAAAQGPEADRLAEERPSSVIARVSARDGAGILYDATFAPELRGALLQLMVRRKTLKGSLYAVIGASLRGLKKALAGLDGPITSELLGAEQSNTSVRFEDRMILKLFRKIEEGVNPDLEIGRHLTERTGFKSFPPILGALELKGADDEVLTLGILQRYVHNEGDAWEHTLTSVGRFFERALVQTDMPASLGEPGRGIVARARRQDPGAVAAVLGTYLESAQMLGKRTAEMHLALGADETDPAFAPEPFTPFFQRALYQSMHALLIRSLQILKKSQRVLDATGREQAERVLGLEKEIDKRFQSLLERKLQARRIRCHGDYHLGQVLYTGKDFVIIDFEGEPARPIGERRIKRSPLRDVAGMVRSFHYAAHAMIVHARMGGEGQASRIRAEDAEALLPWARRWYEAASGVFLRSYLETAGETIFLPRKEEDIEVLLDAFLLEKAIYELGYELNSRPRWAGIPLAGILDLVERKS